MTSLIKSKQLAFSVLKNKPLLYTAIRNHWNKDNKPGPYPVTEQEHIKAAERYGLHPSEYEPYPNDGNGSGDYPKLPLVSGDSKDPFYPYDDPALKRNYQEPLHEEFDLIREDRYDVSARLRVPLRTQVLQYFLVMTGLYAVYYLLEEVKMFHAVIPKQYPSDGKKHYTFETK